ncbi:MAG: DNA repair protein RecO [Bdellovibrionota bacterium]
MQVKDKVFILRKTRYGDNDLILNCLTPAGARISLFARSALKSKKRFGGGVLEPTHYVHVMYEDKSSNRAENPLHTLKEASLIEDFPGVRTDYGRIELALHFVRMISDVVREGEIDSADLFNLLGNSLRAIEKSTALDKLRTQFEVKLLANQGVLSVEADEQALLATPISEHERIPLGDEEWSRLRSKVRAVLREYLDQARPSFTETR